MEITVPQKWNELTPWQLPRLAKALFFPSQNKRHNSFYVLWVLFNKKPTLKNLWQCCKLFSQVPFSELRQWTEFLYKEADLTKFIEIKGLSGPSIRMTNITINEFSYADAFYFRWTQSKKEIELDRLVAILYRKPIHGKRPAFNFKDIPTYAKDTKKLSSAQKIAILLAYQGSRELLIKTNKNVFLKGGGKSKYTPFSKIINNMASTAPQPFGDFYKTQGALLHDFLKVLDQQIADQRKQTKPKKR